MTKNAWSFKLVVWLPALLAVIWLIGTPPMYSLWASRHWTQLPCHVADNGNYFFEINGSQYKSDRHDFWKGVSYTGPAPGVATLTKNGTCWVNPSDPKQAVRFVDAFSNWSNSGRRITSALLVLAVATGVTMFGGRKSRIANANGR